ncbi:MAG: hypothetical protein HY078_04415 [Elusimicrobia bacterium]|nr:hypothetical protein [Elusimicrobiota bacterium]
MKCPKCSFDIPATSKECVLCREPLASVPAAPEPESAAPPTFTPIPGEGEGSDVPRMSTLEDLKSPGTNKAPPVPAFMQSTPPPQNLDIQDPRAGFQAATPPPHFDMNAPVATPLPRPVAELQTPSALPPTTARSSAMRGILTALVLAALLCVGYMQFGKGIPEWLPVAASPAPAIQLKPGGGALPAAPRDPQTPLPSEPAPKPAILAPAPQTAAQEPAPAPLVAAPEPAKTEPADDEGSTPAAAPAPKRKAAPRAWTFEGKIYDLMTLRAVAYAELYFVAEGGETIRATSGGSGRYRVRLPPEPGGYSLQLTHPDYRDGYFDEITPPYSTLEREERLALQEAVSSTHAPWRGDLKTSVRRDLVVAPMITTRSSDGAASP